MTDDQSGPAQVNNIGAFNMDNNHPPPVMYQPAPVFQHGGTNPGRVGMPVYVQRGLEYLTQVRIRYFTLGAATPAFRRSKSETGWFWPSCSSTGNDESTNCEIKHNSYDLMCTF